MLDNYSDPQEIQDGLERISQNAKAYIGIFADDGFKERLARHNRRLALNEAVRQIEQKERCLDVITAEELYNLDLPPVEIFLAPWLYEGALVMISGGAGAGKTWTSNEIARALSTGGNAFGVWSAPQPRRVLFLDGEMGRRGLQKRVQTLGIKNSNLLYFYPERNKDDTIVNIATLEFSNAIIDTVDAYNIDVIIADNVFSLYQSGSDSNSQESWTAMQNFLLKLRDKGKAVILIDHNSKNPERETPLGASSKTFVLDYWILLKKPADYREEEGARFEIHFKKHRELYGDDVKPFTVHLNNGQWEVDYQVSAQAKAGRPQNDANKTAVIEAFNAGVTDPKKISEQTGVAIRTVYEYLKDIRQGYSNSAGFHIADSYDDYSDYQ